MKIELIKFWSNVYHFCFFNSILKKIIGCLRPNGIIVIPLATLEMLVPIVSLLKDEGFDLKVNQHLNLRGVPLMEGTRLNPMNPVFIIKGQLKSKQKN